jgi:hypothetical protein
VHRLLIPAALCLALGACATATPSKSLSVCDGRHRRPANPNGSVLVSTNPTATTPDASFAPCGIRA